MGIDKRLHEFVHDLHCLQWILLHIASGSVGRLTSVNENPKDVCCPCISDHVDLDAVASCLCHNTNLELDSPKCPKKGFV
jgi:hypothetical protein